MNAQNSLNQLPLQGTVKVENIHREQREFLSSSVEIVTVYVKKQGR